MCGMTVLEGLWARILTLRRFHFIYNPTVKFKFYYAILTTGAINLNRHRLKHAQRHSRGLLGLQSIVFCHIKMTDASLWGPKRPQECLLGLMGNGD